MPPSNKNKADADIRMADTLRKKVESAGIKSFFRETREPVGRTWHKLRHRLRWPEKKKRSATMAETHLDECGSQRPLLATSKAWHGVEKKKRRGALCRRCLCRLLRTPLKQHAPPANQQPPMPTYSSLLSVVILMSNAVNPQP